MENDRHSKFIRRGKRPRRGNITLKVKNNVGRPTLSDFKAYYIAIIIKKVWCWRENRQMGQWNRTDSPNSKGN